MQSGPEKIPLKPDRCVCRYSQPMRPAISKGPSTPMSKTTFDMIEPNVAESEVDGANICVTWKCPVSGKIVGKSEAPMQAAASTTRNMSQAVQRSLLDAALAGFVRFIGSTFGGLAGQVAGSAAYPAKAGAMGQIA